MSYRILVVDDHDDQRADLERVLKRELNDWNFVAAPNLKQAKHEVDCQSFEIIVTDLVLDNASQRFSCDGLELAKYVRDKGQRSALILVSSFLEITLNHIDLDECSRLGIEILDRNTSDYSTFIKLLTLQVKHVARRLAKLKAGRSLSDIWSNDTGTTPVYSYWLLVLIGIDIPDQKDIASEALVWQNIICRPEAHMIICQTSPNDPLYDFIVKQLGLTESPDFPVLIFSNNPEMQPNVILKSNALEQLKQKGSFRKFFVNIHTQLKNDGNMKTIKLKARGRQFWEFLKWGAKELSDFLRYVN
jgi:CheY-like chemotaxis protein